MFALHGGSVQLNWTPIQITYEKNILQQLASYNGILTGRNCKWSCHKFYPFISITSIPLSTHSNSDPSQKIALSKTEISFKIFTMVFLRSAHRLFIFGYKYSDQNHYLVWFYVCQRKSWLYKSHLSDRGDDVIWNCLIHTLKFHPFTWKSIENRFSPNAVHKMLQFHNK